MKFVSGFSLFACLLVFSVSMAQAQKSAPTGYHLLQKYPLGGEGGWDYLTVDDKNHRVYISRSSHVMIVDSDTGKVVGDIPDTTGVHGIAIDTDDNRGFTSNGRDNSVTIFDLKTLKMLGKIPVGKNPDAIIYDPHSKRIFTFNGGSSDTTIIDGKKEVVVGTVALGGRPEFAVSDEKGNVFVNLEDKSQVVEFNAKKLNIENRWSLAPGEEPTGIAIDRRHRRLFIGCANQLMAVVNADTGKVITTLPIGDGVDATGFDPESSLAFSSNGDGTLTVIHEDSPDKFSVVENAATQKGARTMTLDAKTHRIYLVSAEFGPPPAPTTERPHPRPSIVPGSFSLLVLGK